MLGTTVVDIQTKEHTSKGTRLYTTHKSQPGDGKSIYIESRMMEQSERVRKGTGYKRNIM